MDLTPGQLALIIYAALGYVGLAHNPFTHIGVINRNKYSMKVAKFKLNHVAFFMRAT